MMVGLRLMSRALLWLLAFCCCCEDEERTGGSAVGCPLLTPAASLLLFGGAAATPLCKNLDEEDIKMTPSGDDGAEWSDTKS